MEFISTRGGGRAGAAEAILKGQAGDGGLFAPSSFPRYFPENIGEINYVDMAAEVLSLYLSGDFTNEEVRGCCSAAYGSGFDSPLIAPVVNVGDMWFLELFHGKTLAFKDMALSILPRLMSAAKKKLGVKGEICILTATSGDTGGAALAGFAGEDGFRAAAFFPEGGVSEVQRLQMVTRDEDNVCAFAVRGNFDEAQKGVKTIFADSEFKEELAAENISLSSANSINIGRLLPQIAYYYYAYGQMVKSGAVSFGEPLNFAVPTGNFGNILAGWYSAKMGLPVGSLLCASNENTVLYDFFTKGVYDANRPFKLTSSPSMDILVSSNLERLLFHMSGGDSALIASLMGDLNKLGTYAFNTEGSGIIGAFANEEETFAAARALYGLGYYIDPHTAVAAAALKKARESGAAGGAPWVIAATASPYKFTPALKNAGIDINEGDAPPAVKALYNKPDRSGGACDIKDMKTAVRRFLGLHRQ